MFRLRLFILIFAIQAGSAPAWAQERKSRSAELNELRLDENRIPKQTSTPPPLVRIAPPDTFSCQRHFIYRGKTLDCDSNLHMDGEKFRPIIRDVPDAVSELDTYQSNRRWVQNLAYLGTLGLLSVLVGFLGGPPKNEQKGITHRIIFAGSGLIVLGLGTGYSLYLLNSNETHLGNMMQKYNQARPSDPIELQFGTKISF